MKKIIFVLLITALFLQYRNSANCQMLNSDDKKFVDSILATVFTDSMPGISVLISKDGKVIYERAIGIADMDSKEKLRPENVLAIGSMSKQFTAVAVLMLVQEGKLKLDEDIKTYLPSYNTHGKKITLENLLTHTSGIPSFTEMKSFEKVMTEDRTPEQIIDMFRDSSLLFDPGTNWSYSNAGFMLAAYIVSKVSGMDFNEFLKSRIFKPLQMSNTFIGSNTEEIPNKAKGYDPLDSIRVQNTINYSWTWPYGAGSIMSTVEDMKKWDEALYTDKLVNQTLLKKAWDNFKLDNGANANYGYGWFLSDAANHKIIFHGGAIGGYLSQALRIPDEHLYVIGLTNTTARNPTEVINAIAMHLIDNDPKLPNEITIQEKNLKEYTGVYEANFAGLRIITNMGTEKEYRFVTTDGKNLFVQRSGGEKKQLIPCAADEFYTKDNGRIYKFERNSDNKIVSVSLHDNPIQYGPVEVSLKTDLPLPESKAEIKVDESVLQKYTGTYQLMPGFDLVIKINDGKFMLQATGQSAVELFAESNTHFFIKEVDAQIDFHVNDNGEATSLTLTQGQKYECKKTE